jgi:hypothetical protein
MKASELRIGNYVYDTLGKVNKIDLEAITYIVKEPHNQVKPIPLTEEWLLKFDEWVKEDDLFVRRLDTINDALRLDYVNDDGELCWEFYVYNVAGQRVGWAYFKYVHQLQNLYFALTGEELVVKE